MEIFELLEAHPKRSDEWIWWAIPVQFRELPFKYRQMSTSRELDHYLQTDPSGLMAGHSGEGIVFGKEQTNLRGNQLSLEGRADAYRVFDVDVRLVPQSRAQYRERITADFLKGEPQDPFAAAWSANWDSKVVLFGFELSTPTFRVQTFIEPAVYEQVVRTPHDYTMDLTLHMAAKVRVNALGHGKGAMPIDARLGDWKELVSSEDPLSAPREDLSLVMLELRAMRSTIRLWQRALK